MTIQHMKRAKERQDIRIREMRSLIVCLVILVGTTWLVTTMLISQLA